MGFDSNHVNDYVLSKQHLTQESRTKDLIQIFKDLVAVHAIDFRTPFLSCFARSGGFKKEELYKELYQKRSLSEVKAMRGSPFIFHNDFVSNIHTALNGTVMKISAFYMERYMNMFGVDKILYDRATKEILEIIGKSTMDSETIKKQLRLRLPDARLWKRDEIVDDKGTDHGVEAVEYIIYSLCDQCKLARVGMEGNPNMQKYIRWDMWFPAVKMKSDVPGSRKWLVEAYVNTFGPVSLKDVQWWTGFDMVETEVLLEGLDVIYAEWEGEKAFEYFTTTSDLKRMTAYKPSTNKSIIMLPMHDSYTMGYKDRSRFVPKEHEKLLFDKDGNSNPAILCSGKVIGTWKYPDAIKNKTDRFSFFEKQNADIVSSVEKEYDRVVKFLSE